MTEANLAITNPEEILALFGPRDQHLRKIRRLFDVQITQRNGNIRISGEGPAVEKASRALERLRNLTRTQGELSPGDIDRVASQEGVPVEGAIGGTGLASDPEIRIGQTGRRVKPRSGGQRQYVEAIRNHDLTLATGPAGCGKTYLAVAMAVEALRAEEVRKIVLVRPAVEAGESLGFLPGDLRAKLNPYLRPLMDALGEMVDYDQSRILMEKDVIEVIPLAYMRGRTLNDAFIILDEAQNTTVAQMKMFLTRMGQRSKTVVSGDTSQLDLPRDVTSGLHDAIARLEKVDEIGMVRLRVTDILRHPLVQRIVEAYDDESK